MARPPKALKITPEQLAAQNAPIQVVPFNEAMNLYRSYLADAKHDLGVIAKNGATLPGGVRKDGSDTLGDYYMALLGHLRNAAHAFTRFQQSAPPTLLAELESLRREGLRTLLEVQPVYGVWLNVKAYA